MMRRHWEQLAVIALLAFALAVRAKAADGWVFAGSDSYGYVKLAEELRLHDRYALAPAPAPLHFGRLPLYPLFIRAVKGEAPAEMSGGEGWNRIKRAQRWLDVLIALPLLYLIARRLGRSRAAGLIALALGAICPFTMLYTGAALSESLAATLCVAAMAPLVLGGARPRVWFTVAGALLGLATLTRPDDVFLAVAFVPALLALKTPARIWRERAIIAALALAGFAVVYSPWPLRNLHQFGHAYPVGSRVDRFGNPTPNPEGWWNWCKTWGPDTWNQASLSTCFYDPPCSPNFGAHTEAFDSPQERATVDTLLARRGREGLSAGVSDGFQKLTDERIRRHPLRTVLWMTAQRWWNMWVAAHDEVLQTVKVPLAPVIRPLRRAFVPISGVLFVAILVSGIALSIDRRTRWLALILFAPLLFRTLAMAYMLFSMPRYTVEVMPFGFALVAVAAVELGRRIRARIATAPATSDQATRPKPAAGSPDREV